MSDCSVALIMTLLNEEKGLSELLASIDEQTMKPDEVVICDSGSTDGTVQIINQWKDANPIDVTIINESGINIAQGRNRAISAAGSSIICQTDGGCILQKEWLREITQPLRNDGQSTGIVYGVTVAVGENKIGEQFAKLHNLKTCGNEVSDFEHSGGCVAFRKSSWEKVGGYPEWLTLAGEDTLFFQKVEEVSGGQPAAGAKVYWHHDEDTLYRIYRKHKRNSIGDGEAGLSTVRYLCLIAIYLLPVIGLFLSIWSPEILLLVLIYLVLACYRHTPALIKRGTKLIDALTIMPAITLYRDLGMSVGFLIGATKRFSEKITGRSLKT